MRFGARVQRLRFHKPYDGEGGSPRKQVSDQRERPCAEGGKPRSDKGATRRGEKAHPRVGRRY